MLRAFEINILPTIAQIALCSMELVLVLSKDGVLSSSRRKFEASLHFSPLVPDNPS